MKILKIDYLRSRAEGYFAKFISIIRLKNEFSLFYLTPALSKLEREK